MIGSYSVQSSVARPTRGPYDKSRILKLKSRVHIKNFIEIDRNLLEMTQYDWQLLCAKQCG